MSAKSYSQCNNEDELLTMVAQGAFLSMGRIMGSYSCIAQVDFEGTYGMFHLWYDDPWVDYVYDLRFSIILKMML